MKKLKCYVIYSENDIDKLSSFLNLKFIPISKVDERLLSSLGSREFVFNIRKYNEIYSAPINDTKISQTLSHIKCFEAIVNNEDISDDDFVLISESTTLLVDDFYNLALEYIRKYDSYYDLITLSDINKDKDIFQDSIVEAIIYDNNDMYNNNGAYLYLIRKSAVRNIIKNISGQKPFWLYDDFTLFCNNKRICKGTYLLGNKSFNNELYDNILTVQLSGGLGNQMFQYAFARSLSLRKNLPIQFETRAFPIFNKNHVQLKIKDFLLNNNTTILNLEESYEVVRTKKVYREQSFTYDSKAFEQGTDVVFHGLWQAEKYFSDIRNILLQEFTLKNSIRTCTLPWLDKILNTNSVSLHIRRGDYMTSGNGILSLQYYIDAIDYLRSKLNLPLDIFVFSNDMSWVKTNLVYNDKKITFHFFDQSEDNYQEEELYLMSCCKHNIIANSSFSWWGAYLNNYPGRVIIAPESWFLGTSSFFVNDNDIIPNDWVKIKNTFL